MPGSEEIPYNLAIEVGATDPAEVDEMTRKMEKIKAQIKDLDDKLGGKVRLPGEQVREFHRVFGMPVNKKPAWVHEREILRRKLILEEFQEFMDEVDAGNLAKAAKEAADCIYVLHGMFAEFGVNLDAVFDEVHRSNMSKLWPDGSVKYRDDGKVLKGPNYFEPDIEALIGL